MVTCREELKHSSYLCPYHSWLASSRVELVVVVVLMVMVVMVVVVVLVLLAVRPQLGPGHSVTSLATHNNRMLTCRGPVRSCVLSSPELVVARTDQQQFDSFLLRWVVTVCQVCFT